MTPTLLRAAILALPLATFSASCGPRDGSTTTLVVEAVPAPTGNGAAEPNLSASADGRVLLSWLEPAADSTVALRFATRGADGAWSEPREVIRRNDLFVNWADFPSIVTLADGRLLAHWLQRAGSGKYAYDVRLAESRDGGTSWGERVSPHASGIPAEHGFVALLPTADSGAQVVLLDGGASVEDGHDPKVMHLAFATWGATGGVTGRTVIDHSVCDCCQTGIATTTKGPVVVYRDRSDDGIRDMSVVRLVDGAWSLPKPVHNDGWKIDFCPVNGPSISAMGDTVVVTWFAAPHDTARVQVAWSTDAGETFGPPLRIDAGTPTGRVDIELIDGGRALVSWLERTGGDEASVLARVVRRGGVMEPPVRVSASKAARSSGFPRMVRTPEGVLMAWTIPGTPSEVRTAVVRVGGK